MSTQEQQLIQAINVAHKKNQLMQLLSTNQSAKNLYMARQKELFGGMPTVENLNRTFRQSAPGMNTVQSGINSGISSPGPSQPAAASNVASIDTLFPPHLANNIPLAVQNFTSKLNASQPVAKAQIVAQLTSFNQGNRLNQYQKTVFSNWTANQQFSKLSPEQLNAFYQTIAAKLTQYQALGPDPKILAEIEKLKAQQNLVANYIKQQQQDQQTQQQQQLQLQQLQQQQQQQQQQQHQQQQSFNAVPQFPPSQSTPVQQNKVEESTSKLPQILGASSNPTEDPRPDSTNRTVSKRKLRQLVQSIEGAESAQVGRERLDDAVEDLLLDIADDFIDSITRFGCQMAKHRKSDRLEVKDLAIHLERNFNIKIPGFAPEESRYTQSQSRRLNLTPAYAARLATIKEVSRRRAQ